MPGGLQENVVENIKHVFVRYPQIEKVILYGSRAKGNFDPGSDIDLTIIGNDIELSMLNRIENDLDDLLLPYKFDLSVLRNITNENLLDHIQRVGIEFYIRSIK